MLRLAQERDHLTVVDDQFGAPTGADLLADVTAHAIRQVRRSPRDAGLYHLASGGETSWFGYVKYVLSHSIRLSNAIQLRAIEVEAVSSSAVATAAKRPQNSRLATSKLQSTFGLSLPHWEQGVTRMLAETLQQ